MTGFLLALTLAAAAQAAPPSTAPALPELPVEQTATIRCAVAFAFVAKGQQDGDERALAYPPLAERGKEFAVRTLAQLMEDPSFTRERVEAYMMKEAQELKAAGTDRLDAVMPACLLALDASGL